MKAFNNKAFLEISLKNIKEGNLPKESFENSLIKFINNIHKPLAPCFYKK
jgi:hypothetical protein